MEESLDLGKELLKIFEPDLDLGNELKKAIEGLDPLQKEAEINKFAKQHGIRKPAIDRFLNEKSQTPIHSAIFTGLVDIVVGSSDKLMFLVRNENGSLDAVESITIDDDILIPPPRKSMKWLIPNSEKVQFYYLHDTNKKLYDDLVAYHMSISELPSEDHYHLLAVWDFHTYLFEKSEYSPYIWLYAIPERGKTRTGKGCIYVAFRGLHVESLRDAYIVRVAENLKSALFVDVVELWKKAEKAGSDDIVLQRFEKGSVVPRVLYPEKGPHQDTVYYEVYGPTIVATNEKVSEILATRAIQIIMPESDRDFPDDVKPENTLELRERLTAFRARHLYDSLPNTTKPCRGRLGDILRPLRQMVLMVAPDEENRFLNLCTEFQNQRYETLEDTLEATILQAIIDLEDEIENRKLPSKTITEKINEDVPEKFHRGQRTITQACKRMGFKAPRSCGQTYIEIDPNLFERLCLRYLRKTALTALNVQLPENKINPESTCESSKSAEVHLEKQLHLQLHSGTNWNNYECAQRADSADLQSISENKNKQTIHPWEWFGFESEKNFREELKRLRMNEQEYQRMIYKP